MNKNLKIALFSFLALGLVTATAVSAHQGPANENQANNFANYENRAERMEEFHANMSEEDLEKMSQMHELMENGEFEEALELRDDLGMRQGMRQGMGQRHGNRANGAMTGFVDANNNGLCDNMENVELN